MRRWIVMLPGLALSACCPPGSGVGDGDNPNGIWLEDATIPAMGTLVEAGLPRQTQVVGSGVSIGDIDNDGDADVVLARVSREEFQTGGPSRLFLNGSVFGQVFLYADEEFERLTINHVVYSSALGDYDADGDLDIFLGCAGPDLLLENRGDGTFRDVSARAGIEGPDGDLTSGGIFADLNNDGLLDLYVSDYLQRNRVYLNLGDETMLEVSAPSGADNNGQTNATAVADLDHDGKLDIYVANDTLAADDAPPPSELPRDEIYAEVEIDDTGIPHYVARTQQYGVYGNRSSRGIGLADFNADGFLDAYVTDTGANELYLWNNDAATYEERSTEWNVENRYIEGRTRVLSDNWGALPIDLDRDGRLELFVVNGSLLFTPAQNDTQRFQQLDNLYRQARLGGAFQQITASAGMPAEALIGVQGQLLTGRGAFHGDLDVDGDDDIVLGAFNEPFRVWMNDTPKQGHYVRVRLKGTVSAPDPIGAILTVQCDDGVQKIGWRTQGGHTYGTSDNVVELACGEARPIFADVQWPSGLVQELSDFVDRELAVEEPRWLELSTRVAAMRDPVPELSFLPVDFGEGKDVVIERSDGVPVTVDELPDAVYVAQLPHPGYARRTVLRITVDGEVLPIRPMMVYR